MKKWERCFVLPYLNHCLIGTTDNKIEYEENPKVKDEEIEYLLNEVNKYFEKPLKKEDILFFGIPLQFCNSTR